MSTISREELKERFDGGGDFKLINCLDDWMFRAKRIPGSIHFESLKHALDTLDPKEEVIVYCSNFGCTARHARVPTTRRPRFSEPQHYEHYAFSQRAAIAERSPQCPGLRAVSRAAADALSCQRSQRNQPRRGVA